MESTRQATLKEAWKDGSSASVTRSSSSMNNAGTGLSHNMSAPERGTGIRGRGRGQSSSLRGRKEKSDGRGTGRGRGRGRGRGAKLGKIVDSTFPEDEEDQICQQAMGQFELNTSDVSKAFESANAAAELPGFDRAAGDIWIYPTNKSVRDYQFQIVQTALFNNTMVSLPTGLGKTFIAAVVMYNFHRWYPKDLVIFMAPTRPLVKQQLEACHNIVGIHPSKTVELTGQTAPKKREDLWKTKSVFFLTPQVMTSDLLRGFCPADQVRCVVVDEAHKALGNHAYAQVISMLCEKKALFRVLALSATPGSDLTAVQQVFKNLMISRVELRSEGSPDILPYIHDKQIDKVVVPIDGYLKTVYDNLVEVYQMYTGKLMKQNVLQGRDGSSFTSYQLLKAREIFREKFARNFPNYVKGYIEGDFATCISLAHSADLLLNHGLRCFFTYLQGVLNKEKGNPTVTAELKKNTNLQNVLTELQQKLNISAKNSSFNLNSSNLFSSFSKSANTSCNFMDENEESPPDYLLSHPKMKVLKEIIVLHFKGFETKNETTRVMIFSQYRDSVQEIGNMLNTLGPLVKPMVFIGQANKSGENRGLKQKDQVQVVQRFRDGGFNVLVSTSVGEEGLDIGEVDLIICFDTSKSPTRLVQRMGRTGRQRQGRIIFLLTKGREERSYGASRSLQNSISKNITDPSKLLPYLYKFSPRMVPNGVEPQCFKMSIVLTSEQDQFREDDVIVIDDDNCKEQPLPKSKKAVLRPKKTSANSDTKLKKTPFSAGSMTSTNNPNERTITQCFDELIQKENQTEKSPLRIGNLAAEKKDATKDTNDMSNDDHSIIIEDHDVMYDMVPDYGDNDLLSELFDVIDAAVTESKSCLNIPRLPKPIKWVSEFNTMKNMSIIANDFNLEYLKERLDSYKVLPSYREKCRCGNINNSPVSVMLEEKIERDVSILQNLPALSVIDLDLKTPKNINSSINSSSSKTVYKKEIGMDEGFIFDENDPIFDDDWEGDGDGIVNNDCGKLKTVSLLNDKKALKMNLGITENFSPIPLFDDSFDELPFDEMEKENAMRTDNIGHAKSKTDFTTPVKKSQFNDRFVLLDSSKTVLPFIPSVSHKDTPIKAYPIINILDDSSTTSNDEEFLSPKQPYKPPAKELKYELSQYRKQSQTKSQVNRDLFKDDLLLFEDDEEFDEEMLRRIENSSKLSPKKTEYGFEMKETNSCSLLTSTPVKHLTLEVLPLEISSPPQCSPRSLTSDLSPDLSQFRFSNRIKRIRLEEPDNFELATTCSQIMDPNNHSAELLNQYVEELRKKRYMEAQNNLAGSNKQNCTISNNVCFTPITAHKHSTSTPTSIEIPTVISTDSSKKIFKFKKKSISEARLDSTKSKLINIPGITTQHPPKEPIKMPMLKPDIGIIDSVTLTKKSNQLSNSKENVVPNTFKSNFDHRKSTGIGTSNLPSNPSPIFQPLLKDDWIDMSVQSVRENMNKIKFKFKPSKSTPTAAEQKMTSKPVPRFFGNSFLNDSQYQTSKLSTKEGTHTKKNQESPMQDKLICNVQRTSFQDTTFTGFNRSEKGKQRMEVQRDYQGPSFKTPLPPRVPPPILWNDDDDFITPIRGAPVTPKTNPRIFREAVVLSPSSDSFKLTGESTVRNFINSPTPIKSLSSSSNVKKTRKRRKLNGNPFIDVEAEVDGDDSSSSVDENDEFEGLDDFDNSFVDNESEEITDTQQIRYIRSVKDFEPIQRKITERILSPVADFNELDTDYEDDSFCVSNDDVEFQDIGVFTQAMNVARDEIDKESPRSLKKRRTRRQAAVAREADRAQLKKSSNSNPDPNKRRRRIIIHSDSSDED